MGPIDGFVLFSRRVVPPASVFVMSIDIEAAVAYNVMRLMIGAVVSSKTVYE